MKALFIHQNFPGQFRHIARHLACQPDWQVVALGEADNLSRQKPVEGVRTVAYRHKAQSPAGHTYLRGLDDQVRRGQAVLRALLGLRRGGFFPDVICVHPSWGEALFLRDAYPGARILNYAEFHYSAEGADVAFDPEFPGPDIDGRCRLRLRNSAHLHALADCDLIWTPSRWQASRLPGIFHQRLEVVHEGLDTATVRPREGATFRLGNRGLTSADTVLTYVARNLEPYRGFHVFMRALPRILAQHPAAEVVVVGGDEVSYGCRAPAAANWREQMLAEVGAVLDPERVHFVGKLPYADYLNLLCVSTAHVYLTYPFVLSWSLLEAMASGCAIVASRTAPVEEVIADGENGRLVDFFDVDALVAAIGELMASPDTAWRLGRRARQTVLERFDLESICLPRQFALFTRLAADDAGPGRERSMETSP